MSYLKTKPGSLEEAIRKHDENYKALFKKELDKAGKSIGQMTPDEKKKFFNKIDKMHTAKNEAKVDELTKAQKKLPPALQKAIKKKEMKEEQISEMKKVEIKLHPQNIDNTIQKIVKHIDIINRNRVQSKKIDVQQNMSDDSVTLIGRGGSDVGREVADIRNFIGFKSAKVVEDIQPKTFTQKVQEQISGFDREIYLAENNIDVIKSIVKNKSAKNIKMKDGSLKMDMFTASAIMNVYNKVNPTNKKKMEDLANGKKSDLMKLQSLAMKFVK